MQGASRTFIAACFAILVSACGGGGGKYSAPPPSANYDLQTGIANMVTSGLSMEKFPPGIPVATVASARLAPGASEPDIALTPLVNLDRVTAVAVLLWSPQ